MTDKPTTAEQFAAFFAGLMTPQDLFAQTDTDNEETDQ